MASILLLPPAYYPPRDPKPGTSDVVGFWGGRKFDVFGPMLKFISQEVPLERATRCFSELTKGRKQPAYVCKWKHQSKHGASALQGLSPCTLPSTREWCRATEAKSSRERAGTATSSTGQLRVAMGSLTAPPGLFSVGSGPTCGICRPNAGAVGYFTAAKSSIVC